MIDGEFRINQGKSLTIEPGVVVKFVPHDDQTFNFSRMLVYGGQLHASGTAANPIVFTSYYDDTAGGDTDGGGRAPERGDWYTMRFTAGSDADSAAMPVSVLNNVSIRYGGEDVGPSCYYGDAINVARLGKLEITRAEIVESLGAGISVSDITPGLGHFSVSHTRFADSACGMYARGGSIFNNIFEPSLSQWSIYAGHAIREQVYGNWMHRRAMFGGSNPTREHVDAAGNAFMAGVDNEPTGQDHTDLRFNHWGTPRARPGECVDYTVKYIPAVDYGNTTPECWNARKQNVLKYFTNVIPMVEAPPVPEVGPGATLAPPGGLPTDGIPFEQTFGGSGGCCLDQHTELQHLTPRPVNTATGSLAEFFTDFAFPGRGVPLAWTRTYNSLDLTTGPMGRGWTFGFNASVRPWGSAGAVKVRSEDGKQVIYEAKDGGGCTRPAGVRSELTIDGTGWRLTKSDQSYLTFNSAGRLTGMKDRFDQGLNLSYTDGVLTGVTDAAGRTATLTYTNGLLAKVTLPDGRSVDYGYTNGQLTTSTDLRGKTTSYAYDANGFLKSAQDANGHFLFRNTFDPETGRVVKQLDPRGKETTFAWDPATQTSTMTDPAGKQWMEVYANNLLVEKRDPLGNSAQYGYDSSLNRISIIDGRNNETRFTYDDAGNMLTRKAPAPLSYLETWTYTTFNEVATYTNGRGKTTSYSYNTDRQLTKVTDRLNRETSFTYTPTGQLDTVTDPRGNTTDYDYDVDGNVASVLSAEGNRTTFAHDDAGRLTTSTDPRGNVTGANPADYATTYTYNAGDHPKTITDPRGNTTSFTYDNVGRLSTITEPGNNVTSFEYNADNQLTKVTDPRDAETTTGYDDRGNVSSITTPAGTVTFTYDAANRRTSETSARGNEAGANPADHTWTFGYDGNGNKISVTNPTAGTTSYAFDELNRLTTVTDALNKATNFSYDANSNTASVTNALGHVTSFGYDDADQRTSQTDPRQATTTFGYDASGNQTQVTTPMGRSWKRTFDGENRLTSTIDPRGNVTGANPADYTTTHAYDPAGHLAQVTQPLNRTTQYQYDAVGNLTALTNGNQHTTSYAYNARDLLASVTGPANTGTTSFGYDDAGNLASRTDAKNRTSTFDHDLAGRLIEKTTPAGTWRYTYDADGNLTATETPAGSATTTAGDGTIARAYDPLGRLTGIDYTDNTPDATYTYNELHLQSMADGIAPGPETYGYDALGQLKSVTRGTTGFTYDYDEAGNLTSRTQPDGTTVTQTWNNDGLPKVLTSGDVQATYGYDQAGNLNQITRPNGVVDTLTYDPNNAVTSVRAMHGNTIVATHDYTYDKIGNPLSVQRAFGGLLTPKVNEFYTYDAADRISKVCYTANCNQRREYTYDAVGNRATENRVGGDTPGLVTLSYNNKDQLTQTSRPKGLLQPPEVITYAYDANGNQTQSGTRTYTYDLANRTTSTTNAGVTTNYTHDGNGTRLTSATGTDTTAYTWDLNNPLPELVAETTGGATQTFINDAAGDPIATLIPATSAGTTGVHYLHTDALGSVHAATDATGTRRASYAYEPFGTARPSPTNQTNLNNPLGFAGEHQDRTTGLYHLRARDYDTTTGRFTALDPVFQAISDPYVSEYLYANNRPGVLTDPSGMDCKGPDFRCQLTDAIKGATYEPGDCPDTGGLLMEFGEGICKIGGHVASTINHPGEAVAGAGSGTISLAELVGLGDGLTFDPSDVYDAFVAEQFGINTDGPAYLAGQIFSPCPVAGALWLSATRFAGRAAKFEDGAFRLIGANRATIDPRKLTDYALNPNHPVGGNKARVFESALGFNRSNADDLMAQLRRGVMENTPIPGKVDKWGTRFTVDIPVTGPAGAGVVRTGWIYTPGSTTPSLNTLMVR